MKKLTFFVIIISLITTVLFAQSQKPNSVSKVEKISSITSYDTTKYYIAFLRKGNLWIMLEDGTQQRQLTQSGKIIALTCKDDEIFYGERDGSKLIVRCKNLNDVEKIERAFFLNGDREDFFIEEMTEYPKGEMGWVSEGILGVSGNYECCDAAGFRDAISINLKTNQIEHTNLFDAGAGKHIGIKTNREIDYNVAEKKSKPFFTRKTGKEYELYYINDKNKEVRISNTQQYTPRECWGENVTQFSYVLTNTGKIVYWFITGCGDMAHCVIYIGNLDGTNQVQITDDFIPGYENFNIQPGNGEFIICLYDTKSRKNYLVSYVGENNQKTIIAEEIDYFEIVK